VRYTKPLFSPVCARPGCRRNERRRAAKCARAAGVSARFLNVGRATGSRGCAPLPLGSFREICPGATLRTASYSCRVCAWRWARRLSNGPPPVARLQNPLDRWLPSPQCPQPASPAPPRFADRASAPCRTSARDQRLCHLGGPISSPASAPTAPPGRRCAIVAPPPLTQSFRRRGRGSKAGWSSQQYPNPTGLFRFVRLGGKASSSAEMSKTVGRAPVGGKNSRPGPFWYIRPSRM
jgi:hypothetical protein